MAEYNAAQASGAPMTIKRGKQVFDVYPIRDIDWGFIEQWMRTEMIRAFRDAISKEKVENPEQIRLFTKTLFNEAEGISINKILWQAQQQQNGDMIDVSSLGLLGSMEGILRIIHRSLRDKPGKDGRLLYDLETVSDMLGGDLMLKMELFQTALQMSFPIGEIDEKNPSQPQPQNMLQADKSINGSLSNTAGAQMK